MLEFHYPEKVKLFFGVLYSDDSVYKKFLASLYTSVDIISAEYDFSHTDYYSSEMGDRLKRRFIAVSQPVDPHCAIIKAKHWAVHQENLFSADKKRLINIDPGYLNSARLVLTSTKDFSHRVYIGNGVFAEITLIYKNKRFNSLEWTFPDYRKDTYWPYFYEIRKKYTKQL